MKSRRRHELQHNVLDAELGRVIAFFKKRGAQIAWGVVIAALIVLVVVYVRGKRRQEREEVLANYNYAVRSLEAPGAGSDELLGLFKQLAEQDTNEPVAAMACVHVGDLYSLRMLLAGAGQSEAEDKSLAKKAATWYRQAIEDHPDELLAVAKAHLGLAKLAESKRDFATARSEYQVAVEAAAKTHKMPGRLVVNEAERAMDRLERISEPVAMATTSPAPPATKPATQPATKPATQPATGPATQPAIQPTTEPATQPATQPA